MAFSVTHRSTLDRNIRHIYSGLPSDVRLRNYSNSYDSSIDIHDRVLERYRRPHQRFEDKYQEYSPEYNALLPKAPAFRHASPEEIKEITSRLSQPTLMSVLRQRAPASGRRSTTGSRSPRALSCRMTVSDKGDGGDDNEGKRSLEPGQERHRKVSYKEWSDEEDDESKFYYVDDGDDEGTSDNSNSNRYSQIKENDIDNNDDEKHDGKIQVKIDNSDDYEDDDGAKHQNDRTYRTSESESSDEVYGNKKQNKSTRNDNNNGDNIESQKNIKQKKDKQKQSTTLTENRNNNKATNSTSSINNSNFSNEKKVNKSGKQQQQNKNKMTILEEIMQMRPPQRNRGKQQNTSPSPTPDKRKLENRGRLHNRLIHSPYSQPAPRLGYAPNSREYNPSSIARKAWQDPNTNQGNHSTNSNHNKSATQRPQTRAADTRNSQRFSRCKSAPAYKLFPERGEPNGKPRSTKGNSKENPNTKTQNRSMHENGTKRDGCTNDSTNINQWNNSRSHTSMTSSSDRSKNRSPMSASTSYSTNTFNNDFKFRKSKCCAPAVENDFLLRFGIEPQGNRMFLAAGGSCYNSKRFSSFEEMQRVNTRLLAPTATKNIRDRMRYAPDNDKDLLDPVKVVHEETRRSRLSNRRGSLDRNSGSEEDYEEQEDGEDTGANSYTNKKENETKKKEEIKKKGGDGLKVKKGKTTKQNETRKGERQKLPRLKLVKNNEEKHFSKTSKAKKEKDSYKDDGGKKKLFTKSQNRLIEYKEDKVKSGKTHQEVRQRSGSRSKSRSKSRSRSRSSSRSRSRSQTKRRISRSSSRSKSRSSSRSSRTSLSSRSRSRSSSRSRSPATRSKLRSRSRSKTPPRGKSRSKSRSRSRSSTPQRARKRSSSRSKSKSRSRSSSRSRSKSPPLSKRRSRLSSKSRSRSPPSRRKRSSSSSKSRSSSRSRTKPKSRSLSSRSRSRSSSKSRSRSRSRDKYRSCANESQRSRTSSGDSKKSKEKLDGGDRPSSGSNTPGKPSRASRSSSRSSDSKHNISAKTSNDDELTNPVHDSVEERGQEQDETKSKEPYREMHKGVSENDCNEMNDNDSGDDNVVRKGIDNDDEYGDDNIEDNRRGRKLEDDFNWDQQQQPRHVVDVSTSKEDEGNVSHGFENERKEEANSSSKSKRMISGYDSYQVINQDNRSMETEGEDLGEREYAFYNNDLSRGNMSTVDCEDNEKDDKNGDRRSETTGAENDEAKFTQSDICNYKPLGNAVETKAQGDEHSAGDLQDGQETCRDELTGPGKDLTSEKKDTLEGNPEVQHDHIENENGGKGDNNYITTLSGDKTDNDDKDLPQRNEDTDVGGIEEQEKKEEDNAMILEPRVVNGDNESQENVGDVSVNRECTGHRYHRQHEQEEKDEKDGKTSVELRSSHTMEEIVNKVNEPRRDLNCDDSKLDSNSETSKHDNVDGRNNDIDSGMSKHDNVDGRNNDIDSGMSKHDNVDGRNNDIDSGMSKHDNVDGRNNDIDSGMSKHDNVDGRNNDNDSDMSKHDNLDERNNAIEYRPQVENGTEFRQDTDLYQQANSGEENSHSEKQKDLAKHGVRFENISVGDEGYDREGATRGEQPAEHDNQQQEYSQDNYERLQQQQEQQEQQYEQSQQQQKQQQQQQHQQPPKQKQEHQQGQQQQQHQPQSPPSPQQKEQEEHKKSVISERLSALDDAILESVTMKQSKDD